MPPPPRNHDPFRNNLAVAMQMFADDVDVIKLALLDGKDRCVANTVHLETAEFWTLQRYRCIHGRCGDDIIERHTHAKKFRECGELIKCRAIDAKRMDIG